MGALSDEHPPSAPRDPPAEERPPEAAVEPVWPIDARQGLGLHAEAHQSLAQISAEFRQARALLKEAFRLAPEEARPLDWLVRVTSEASAVEGVEPVTEGEPALIVECAGVLAALPSRYVAEVLTGTLKRAQHADGRQSVRVRGRAVKLASLAQLLRLDAPPPEHACAVVLRVGETVCAILVDHVYAEEDVTIEDGPRSRVVAGAAVLSDGGEMVLIDVEGVAASFGAKRAKPRAEETPRVALLVFRGADGAVRAAPLSLVQRIEPLAEAVCVEGEWMASQRNGLIATLDSEGQPVKAEEKAQLIVFAREGQEIALVAEEVIEVAECHADAPLQNVRGVSALRLNGRAAELVDINRFWSAPEEEVAPASSAHTGSLHHGPRVLIASAIVPTKVARTLAEQGYSVTAESEPEAALDRHDRGERFDVILIDVEGEESARMMRALRRAHAWQEAPMFALPREVDDALLADLEAALS